MSRKTIRAMKYVLTIGLMIWMVKSYGQELDVDPLNFLGGGSKYYQNLKENLYRDDEFVNELSDPKSKRTYFRVFFNGRNAPETVGYYMKVSEENNQIEKTKLVQQVNLGKRPYYTIKYIYHQEDETLIRAKYYKDYHGRTVEYYLYHWNFKARRMKKLEIFERMRNINENRLRGYYQFVWSKSGVLEHLSYYDQGRMIIEKYDFMDGLKMDWDLKAEYPEYGIGNHQIHIGYLDRYDRYRKGGKQETEYYIKFKMMESNLLAEKYNRDGILVFEKLYKDFVEISGKEEEGKEEGGTEIDTGIQEEGNEVENEG